MLFLTKEQRKRMEENRQEALRRRALKSGRDPLKSSSSQLSINLNYGKNHNSVSSSNTLPQIKGQCVLISSKRFSVEISYHKGALEIFRSIPTGIFDMKTKKWNFSTKFHDVLIASLKQLQPHVLIIPLPRPVVEISLKETGKMKEYDLSHLDPTIVKALFPFQKIGVYFGIQHEGKVLIADDMGLGKTIQSIAIANYFMKDWPLLVVTPSCVKYTWRDAFHAWLPSVGAKNISIINSSEDPFPNSEVIILNYDILPKLEKIIVARQYKSIIFDESHFLKNPNAARTKAAQAVMQGMKHIIMLSGTPALSRPIELFTQVSALCPKYFNDINEYGMRYCNGRATPWGKDFSGSSNMTELKMILEDAVMLRRLKSDVIAELPSKCRQLIVLNTQTPVSSSFKESSLNARERRGCLIQYFHDTGAVKVPAICEYILHLLERDKKFLCFAHHHTVLNAICACIKKNKTDFICIDGSVTAEQRKNLCNHFQESDACKVAVLSIMAANCGIHLTAASLVIFAELYWNPGILVQAEDRAHRIGQKDAVMVQYLVAKNTADDVMWPMVQRKLAILNEAGLSKDNFMSVETVFEENPQQSNIDKIWNELLNSESSSATNLENNDKQKKRAKIELF